MKAVFQYFLALLAGIGLVGLVGWAMTDAAGRKTVLVSGAVAIVVQMSAFALARGLRHRQLMLGWGLGSVLRVIALVLYAVIAVGPWRAPAAPALLSFVGMLFVTTVVEPIFLTR